MRLFFAVALPDDVRSRLAGLAKELERRAGDVPVSWVPEANIHITLRFLGELAEAERESALEAAREVAAAGAPFKIVLEGAGSFPAGRRPRVIWVGVREDGGLALLRTVAQALERGLVERGFERADHPFAGHATLARVRDPRGPRRGRRRVGRPEPGGGERGFERLALALESHRAFEGGTVDLDRFVLFESVLRGGKNPEYVPVETFALGAGQVAR